MTFFVKEAKRLSSLAEKATLAASVLNTSSAHIEAAEVHVFAAQAHENESGKNWRDKVDYHRMLSRMHDGTAAEIEARMVRSGIFPAAKSA